MGFKEEIGFLFSFFNIRKKKLKYCRNLWKGNIEKIRDFDQISVFFNYKKNNKEIDVVDDSTWNDLDMNSIFSKLDNNVSNVGQQVLYDRLRTYKNKSKLEMQKFHTELHVFSKEEKFRENIQLILLKLNSNNIYNLSPLLFEKLPQKPKFFIFYKISSFMSFIFTIACFFSSSFYNPLFIMVCINISSYFLFNQNILEHLPSIQALFDLLSVSTRLSSIEETKGLSLIKFFQKNRDFSGKMKKGLDFLLTDPLNSDVFTAVLFFYLNFAFQLSLFSFFNLKTRLEDNREKIIQIFETVGELDIQISLASISNRVKFFSIPEFNSSKTINIDSIYHPLLEDPVPNSLHLEHNSMLITGSNMAGKTTFIKTLGVNIILARTLFFCLAKSVNIPELIIKSMIKREDNLEEGKSYYFREVEKIGEFLKLCETKENILFLIDEVFRGTNTVERISASKAVLEYMSKNNFIFATTHDVELQDLLKKNYIMYNFSEIILHGQYTFDYLLKKGSCKTRNAIKLLEISEYPKEVLKNARSIVELIEKNRIRN